MSGRYNGLQAKVKELRKYADFVPCCAHSLNLVGTCAAECCPQALLFFTFVASLYNFFSATPSHRKKLITALSEESSHPLTIKKLSKTRWAERADAVLALKVGYTIIITVLDAIANSTDQKPKVRLQAEGLVRTMNKLETGIMTIFWNRILQRFQMTSASLQAENLCLNTANSL